MRTYITPVKLHKFDNNIPDTCIKCNEERSSLFHCIWTCIKVKPFWRDIIDMIYQLLSIQLPLSPKFLILGLYPVDSTLQQKYIRFIDSCILQAKRVVALNWKNVDGPKISMWVNEIASNMSMEKITYIVKGKRKMFEDIWGRFLHFLEHNNNVGNTHS